MDRFGIEGVDVFVSIFFLIFFGGWNRFEILSFFFDVKVCFRRNTRVFVRGLLKEKVFLCVTR